MTRITNTTNKNWNLPSPLFGIRWLLIVFENSNYYLSQTTGWKTVTQEGPASVSVRDCWKGHQLTLTTFIYTYKIISKALVFHHNPHLNYVEYLLFRHLLLYDRARGPYIYLPSFNNNFSFIYVINQFIWYRPDGDCNGKNIFCVK